MRSWLGPLLVVALAAAAGFAFTHQAAPNAASPQLAVEQRLMCPRCQQTRLDVCDRPVCTDMKADIARRLAAGEPADSIVGSYQQAFGPSILSSQQPSGAAGLLPWAALAIGLAGLAFLALRRRWIPPPASASAGDTSLDSELAAWRSGR